MERLQSTYNVLYSLLSRDVFACLANNADQLQRNGRSARCFSQSECWQTHLGFEIHGVILCTFRYVDWLIGICQGRSTFDEECRPFWDIASHMSFRDYKRSAQSGHRRQLG